MTFGYPTGGESLCITAGVVSRVDVVSNVHCAFASVTAIQIDAAINPGASGGPAVQVGPQAHAAREASKGVPVARGGRPAPLLPHAG